MTLRRLPRASLSKLVPIVSEIYVRSDQTIVERGMRTSSFFILGKGEADLYDPVMEERISLKAGDSFGELALLGVRSTSQATVIARTNCIFYVIQRDKFVQAFAGLPEHINRMQSKAALRAIERLEMYHARKNVPVNPRTAQSIQKLLSLAHKDVFTGSHVSRLSPLHVTCRRRMTKPGMTRGRATCTRAFNLARRAVRRCPTATWPGATRSTRRTR